MSVTALLQSGTSPPLESHYGLGQFPADEREAECQVATQPFYDEALGQSEHVVTDHVLGSGPQGIHVVTDHLHDLIGGTQPCSSVPSSVRESQQMDISEEIASSSASQPLNPDADNFVMKDASLVYGGCLRPDLDADWTNVQEVHSGTVSY